MKKTKKPIKRKKREELKRTHKINQSVKKDMELINNESLPKKDFFQSKRHIWCRNKEQQVSIAVCDRDCYTGFCSERMSLIDDESSDYQKLNNAVIKKALMDDKTQRRLFLYLEDGRLIKILGGFTIHENEQPPKDINIYDLKRKLIKKSIITKKDQNTKKPIIKKEIKITKNNNENNRRIKKSDKRKIIKPKLKLK